MNLWKIFNDTMTNYIHIFLCLYLLHSKIALLIQLQQRYCTNVHLKWGKYNKTESPLKNSFDCHPSRSFTCDRAKNTSVKWIITPNYTYDEKPEHPSISASHSLPSLCSSVRSWWSIGGYEAVSSPSWHNNNNKIIKCAVWNGAMISRFNENFGSSFVFPHLS